MESSSNGGRSGAGLGEGREVVGRLPLEIGACAKARGDTVSKVTVIVTMWSVRRVVDADMMDRGGSVGSLYNWLLTSAL